MQLSNVVCLVQIVLLTVAIMLVSSIGGVVGVAASLGQQAAELSAENRLVGIVAGLAIGAPSGLVTASIAYHVTRNRLVVMVVGIAVSHVIAAIVLYVYSATLAAV